MSAANDLQNAAIAQANSYAGQLQTFLGQLQALTGIVGLDQAVPNVIDVAGIQSALSSLMTTAQLTPPVPVASVPMPLIAVPEVAALDEDFPIPEIANLTAPNIATLAAPSVDNIGFAGVRPDIATLTAPARPTITLPAVPGFSNIVMPTITDVALPVFSIAAPTGDDLTAPTSLFAFSETAYESALLDASKAKLLADLTDGGYGIETGDEDALWARARERELRGADTAMQEATRQMAARGFSLPPGALLAQLQNVQQSAMAQISTVSRDIALKRADMYVENRKFTFAQVRELEQLSVQMHLSVMERTLNAAKSVAEFGVAIYNARIAKFNALMDGFKAKVAAYDSQVRGALGQLEAQKIKLQVVSTEVDVQKNQAQLYGIQVDGAKALMDLYRSDVAALQGLADVERLKLDVFRSEVEVYAERLRAGSLRLQGYEAQVRGSLTQVEVFKTQVAAQQAQVDVSKVQASIVESNGRVKTENLRALIAAAVAQADIYRAQTQGVSADNESMSRAYTARTEALRAVSSIYDSMGKLDVAQFDATTRTALANSQNNIELAKMVYHTRLGAATAGSDALGKAMQGALNQVLGIASVAGTE